MGALGSDLFGDSTSGYTGVTTFTATDVSVPGNNGLAVAVGRSFHVSPRAGLGCPGLFADWDLEIPHLQGIFPLKSGNGIGWQVTTYQQPDARCSVSGAGNAMPPDAIASQGGIFTADEYWHGNSLYVPGQGSQEMLVVTPENGNRPTDGTATHWLTQSQWMFPACRAQPTAYPAKRSWARAPDGTRYWFNWLAKRPATTLHKSADSAPLGIAAPDEPTSASASRVEITPPIATDAFLGREEVWILPHGSKTASATG